MNEFDVVLDELRMLDAAEEGHEELAAAVPGWTV